MEIQNKQEGHRGQFFVEQDGEIAAQMLYTLPSEGLMIIEHTEVGDALRGQQVGYQLVKTAVDFARTHHRKIIPVCPFAGSVFKKKPEFSDVLLTKN